MPTLFDRDNLKLEFRYDYNGETFVYHEVVSYQACRNSGMYMTHDQQQCVLDCPTPYLNNSNSHICVCSLSALDGTTCVDTCGGNQTTAAVPGSEAARQCVC